MAPSPEILVVQPPVQHPACFSSVFIEVVARLRNNGMNLVCFHAGVDFTVRFAMAAALRPQLEARIRKRYRQGAYRQAEESVRREVEARLGHPEGRTGGNDAVSAIDPAALRQTGTFYDPVTAGQVLAAIDTACRRVSLAFYPARIDRRGFSDPELVDTASLMDFLDDDARNPFLDYVRHHGTPPVSLERCRTVLFAVATRGQLTGALTLARSWCFRFPSLRVQVHAADARLQSVADEWLVRACGAAVGPAGGLPSRPEGPAGCDEPDLPDLSADLLLPPETEREAPLVAGVLQPEAMTHLLTGAGSAGRVIAWHDPGGDFDRITTLLFQAAKAGCWNHAVFSATDDSELVGRLIAFAGENPYILHSWCRREPAKAPFSDAVDRFPVRSPSYGETRPLAGRPLWHRLQDPIYLQRYVAQLGSKAVARLRLVDDDRARLTLGSRLSYHFVPPERLPPGYLDEICRMVAAGGTVKAQWVRYNLERAFLVGYVEENGIIAGNSSLKRPRQAYVDAVSAQCGIDLRSYLERGYTSVRPEYRSLGIGAKLLEGLTERAEGHKIYSVIAQDNVATQKMAIRNRTRMVASYFSERTGKQIGIWIPEWMLPEGVHLPPQPLPE